MFLTLMLYKVLARTCKIKRFVTEVIVIAAFARSLDALKGITFDEKIEI